MRQGQDEKSSLKSGKYRRRLESLVRQFGQKDRAGKLPKKQRGRNGMIGEWGQRIEAIFRTTFGNIKFSYVWLGRHTAFGA